jgi:UTP:GlnB (protein PII) uridylyltransferase
MPQGTSLNLYVSKRQVALLDSIAVAMSEGDIGIQPIRSQLVSKAIENFIEACRKREDLRRAIEASSQEFAVEPRRTNSRDKKTQRLSLVSPAS